MVTVPRETGRVELASAKPVIVIVAGFSDLLLIFAHVAASGLHVRVAIFLGVNCARSSPEPAFGSISLTCREYPGASTRIPPLRLAKVTSITHRFALPLSSRQRKVGGVISGGKTEPSSG